MDQLAPVYDHVAKFKEATEHLRQKVQVPTERYRDLQGLIHAKAFTVAGATKQQLLSDLFNAVGAAIADGETLNDFRKRFDTIVKEHGWSYNGGRGWRTQVIYQNNKNTARAAGRWQQQQRTKAKRPYLLYLTAGDHRVRKEHHAWDYILLPVDDPFWTSHYPPNGWGCRCRVVSMSDRDVERSGLTVTDQSMVDKYQKVHQSLDAETGELTPYRIGIDQGWDYNPGKGWLGPDVAVGKSIVNLPADVRASAIPAFNNAVLKAKPEFINTVNRTAANIATGRAIDDSNIFSLGHLPHKIISQLLTRTPITNSLVTISSGKIAESLKGAVAIESIYNVMDSIHRATSFKATGNLIKIMAGDFRLTIEIASPMNKVIAIEKI
jgi:SPP1 gp7 family putative phage head morphogenesis protein